MGLLRPARLAAGPVRYPVYHRYVKRLSQQSRRTKAFIANADDIRPQFRSDENAFLSQNAIFNSTLVRDTGVPVDATIDSLSGVRLDDVSGFKEEAKPWYSDQILPFDVTLAGTNEMGQACAMKIFGVEILNEGSGISIDDAVQEMQATFVAQLIDGRVLFVVITRCFAVGEETGLARASRTDGSMPPRSLFDRVQASYVLRGGRRNEPRTGELDGRVDATQRDGCSTGFSRRVCFAAGEETSLARTTEPNTGS